MWETQLPFPWLCECWFFKSQSEFTFSADELVVQPQNHQLDSQHGGPWQSCSTVPTWGCTHHIQSPWDSLTLWLLVPLSPGLLSTLTLSNLIFTPQLQGFLKDLVPRPHFLLFPPAFDSHIFALQLRFLTEVPTWCPHWRVIGSSHPACHTWTCFQNTLTLLSCSTAWGTFSNHLYSKPQWLIHPTLKQLTWTLRSCLYHLALGMWVIPFQLFTDSVLTLSLV